ncbi:MAG: PspA/IM30 family protein [Pseudobacteriovorax sp.]|nr:PspA/IM30 family protein [Pseudobacteriovorax sp.]
MSFFSRISTLFKAKANEAMDQVEAKNAIPILKEKIEELKRGASNIDKSRAQLKADIKLNETQVERSQKESDLYLKKAKELKAKGGDEAMALAKQYVERHLETNQRIEPQKTNLESLRQKDTELRKRAETFKDEIRKWQAEITALEARSRTAEAELAIEKAMSQTDPDSTLAMMEKLKGKVEAKEALAASYKDIKAESTSLDEKADALLKDTDSSADDLLAKL